jgi:membrane-associated phospholipid phosphatase
LLDQAGFLAHFEGLRAGTFHVIRFDDIEGLISFPSFHVAGAFMVTWALRRTRRLVWIPVALLNVALVASTVLLGAHYAVDILATAVLFGASVLAHFIVVRRFLDPLAGEPLLALHPPHA